MGRPVWVWNRPRAQQETWEKRRKEMEFRGIHDDAQSQTKAQWVVAPAVENTQFKLVCVDKV